MMNKISSEDFAKMEMLLGQIPELKVVCVSNQVMRAIDDVCRYGHGVVSLINSYEDSAKPTANRPYYQRGRW